jgi:transcription termination factor Rho
MVSMIAADSSTNAHEGTQLVLERLHKTKTNAEFLATLTKGTLG